MYFGIEDIVNNTINGVSIDDIIRNVIKILEDNNNKKEK